MITNIETDKDGRFSYKGTVPISDKLFLNVDSEVAKGDISTMDLITIQMHVNEHVKLENMYDLAAADIDNNGAINGLDVQILRGYLLGLKMYNNSSPRLIHSSMRLF